MSATFEQWSALLVYGAIAAYAVALVALAAGSSLRLGRASAVPEPALVGAAGAASADGADGPRALDAAPAGSQAVGRGERSFRAGASLMVLGTLLTGLAVLTRALAAERPPWGNMYEFAVTGAFLAGALWLVLLRRFPVLRVTAVWVDAILLCTLGIAAVVLYVPVGPLVPALQSWWLVVHVLAAMLSAAVFTVAMVVSALQIVRERAERRGVAVPAQGYVRTLPPAAKLDALAYRVTAFAFPVWTFAIVAGAIWASRSWGQAWQWDPKEVWSLVTWLAYAAYLHARTTAGWQGRRASLLGLVAYGTLLFNFFGVNIFLVGLHSYAG